MLWFMAIARQLYSVAHMVRALDAPPPLDLLPCIDHSLINVKSGIWSVIPGVPKTKLDTVGFRVT
jgi:hypothetical protein